jgi:hypothetical protein
VGTLYMSEPTNLLQLRNVEMTIKVVIILVALRHALNCRPAAPRAVRK